MTDIIDGMSNKDAFMMFLDLYKFSCKEVIERIDLVNQLLPDSPDYRIHNDILRSRLIPRIDEYGSMLYSAILRFNEGNDKMGLTREDVLKIQLVQDEGSDMLRKAGANVNFIRDGKPI